PTDRGPLHSFTPKSREPSGHPTCSPSQNNQVSPPMLSDVHAAAHAAAVGRRIRAPSRTPARPTNGLATATHAGCFAFIIASRFPTSPVRDSAGVAAPIRPGIADNSPRPSPPPASPFGGVALRAIQAHTYPPRTAAPIPSAKLTTVHSSDGS